MNGENASNSIKQSQIEEVKQSLNRITLNFRSKELQQQYELGVYKQKANQLIKIYILLTLVTAVGIIQYSIKASSKNNTIFLILLLSLTFIFALITILLKYLPKFICIWNLIAILCFNTHVILLYFLSTDIQTQHDFLGFALISTVACFILQRYNHNFLLILLSLFTTFVSFCLYLEFSLFGFLSIALIISLYSLYQTEYLQKQAFWLERFNSQQNHIIENVVTSSLFYIRYNQKEERLEFQRGNKRFCDKFEVKDDDSMRYFLKNTKISHKSEEQQTINSMWNSVNNNWKSSLDGLIHIKIKEQETKIQTQQNLNVINKQIKDLENEISKEKNQISNNQQLIQQQLSNNQTNPQPLSIIESNGQSGYLSHKSSPVQKKNSPKAISKLAAQTALLHNEINLNEIDKDKQILSRDELDNNLIPSSSYMSRQNINIFSPPNQNRKNYLLTDEQGSASKKVYGEDDQEKERDDSKDQSKQMNHKNKKFKRINSGPQNINQPSPQPILQRTFTWRNNSSDTQVYKAKYTNQAGEKIKFLIRILIFKMNDTYIAVSIEKEEKSKKYKQLKSKISFFEQIFNQMINDCDKILSQELSVIRKLIPLSSLQQQQLQQLNQTNQNITNQLSSQLLSLNIEYPRRHSIEKNILSKQFTRESSFSVINQEKKEFGSLRQIKQKDQSLITNFNTAATSSPQQDVTLNQDNNNTLGSAQAIANNNQNNSLFQTNYQTGILKKPSLQTSPINQQIAFKSSKQITNIQDIPQRISFQVQSNSANVANNAASTILKSDFNDASKTISPSEKIVQIEYQSVLPNQSLFYQLNQSLLKPTQQNTQSLYQFSTFNNLQKNGIPPPSSLQSNGQIQQNLYKLLFSVYNRKYNLMNYNYFFQFFKKRTHLEAFSNINLSQIIENVIQMFKQEVKQKKIQIFTDYLDNEAKVTTDQNALRQIIYNLLYNAIQNTPKNGFVALRVQIDNKYNDCIKIKVRNSFNQYSADKSLVSTPYQEDCKFKIDEMISYLKRKGRVNLGLRISQRLIKIIGPTDKIILKGEKLDCFQVEFSFYANLNVVQKGSFTQFPSQKALHSSYANSYDKNNNQSEKGLNVSNFQNANAAVNPEGQASEQPKKNLLGLYQTVFKAQNPFQNQLQDRIINSDQSFDSYIEQIYNQEQAFEQDFERKVFSADRFKHLN